MMMKRIFVQLLKVRRLQGRSPDEMQYFLRLSNIRVRSQLSHPYPMILDSEVVATPQKHA